MNTIGGAALKVGSVKVSTINLARIAYETNNEQEYLTQLKNTLEINLKLLDCQRNIIQRNIEKGLLHTFDCKMIEMEYLYSSIGIMGIFETMKKFGYTYEDDFGNTYYKDEAFSFGKKIFKVIHNTKDLFLLEDTYSYLSKEILINENKKLKEENFKLKKSGLRPLFLTLIF